MRRLTTAAAYWSPAFAEDDRFIRGERIPQNKKAGVAAGFRVVLDPRRD